MPYKDTILRKKYARRYMREIWYPKNRKKHIAAVKQLKVKLATFLAEYKKKGICADCGYSGSQHPYVLDFDHKPTSRKSFDIGAYTRHVLSIPSLIKEMKKCDIVCANCHRIRTWRNKGY